MSRVGENEVGLEVRESLVVEGVAVRDLAVEAAEAAVHLDQPPSGVVALLAVDREMALALSVCLGLGTKATVKKHSKDLRTTFVSGSILVDFIILYLLFE